jgi:hypothetical protein
MRANIAKLNNDIIFSYGFMEKGFWSKTVVLPLLMPPVRQSLTRIGISLAKLLDEREYDYSLGSY